MVSQTFRRFYNAALESYIQGDIPVSSQPAETTGHPEIESAPVPRVHEEREKMSKRTVMVALLVGMFVAAPLSAAWYFDPACEFPEPGVCGWVGKGDVQSVFAWNNHTMQTYHDQVEFRYQDTQTTSWDCEHYKWDQRDETFDLHNTVSHTRLFGVTGTIAYQSRKTGQWTGWFLTGATLQIEGESAGPQCPQAGANGDPNSYWVLTNVVTTTSGGGLQVRVPDIKPWTNLP